MKMSGRVERVIGCKIRDRREELGWSRDDLAAIAKIDSGSLKSVESGEKRASMDDLVAICAALDVPMENLFADLVRDDSEAPTADGLPARFGLN
jgi:transcriptional regulator with XRE-family HTH domain